MIHTIRTVAVGDQESKIDSPIILYRGDREVEVEFTINGSKFTFTNGGNVIKSTNATHGQLVINTPTGENMFSEVTECHDGKVVFVITKEMIDELIEVGFYSFQIRLFDESQVSRVTIPPVLKGIDIRNPIAAEDETNVVDIGLVDYAVVVKDEFEDLSTFLPDGNYNKTEWESKDVISGAKLNKIEDALYNINHNMEAADLSLLNRVENINKTVHGEIDKLGDELDSEVEEFERELNNNVERFKIDTNAAMTAHKNEVSEELESVNSQLAHITIQVYSNGVGDSDNINNAILSLTNNGGGTLLLPSKEYIIDKEIIYKSNVKLYSQFGSILKQKDNVNLANLIKCDTVNNICFENLTFDLNIDNQSEYIKGQEANLGRSILFVNCNKVDLNNIKCVDMFGTQLYFIDSENIIIDRCEINDSFGRYTTALYLVRCKSAKVINSRFIGQREFGANSSSYGVQAKDSITDIIVDNCYFEKFQCLIDGSKSTDNPLVLKGSNVRITNNVIMSPSADTTIRYCSGGVIANNIVRDSGDYGISVGNAENVIVNGNFVQGSNTVGIGIRMSKFCTVTNNNILNPCTNFRPDYPLIESQRCGIYVVGNCDKITILNNTIMDNLNSPSKMFHAIRVEDFANSIKGDDTSNAIIDNNICVGSKSGIDIYSDGSNNLLMSGNYRADNKRTPLKLGNDIFYTSSEGDLRNNTLTKKPYYHNGNKWCALPTIVDRPTSPSSDGNTGDIAYDNTYFYFKHDTNWKRVAWDTSWV